VRNYNHAKEIKGNQYTGRELRCWVVAITITAGIAIAYLAVTVISAAFAPLLAALS
jgi:hypothetical protein